MAQAEEKKKEILKKWFRKDNLIILVLLGILLFIIALPVKKDDGSSMQEVDGTGELFSDTMRLENAAGDFFSGSLGGRLDSEGGRQTGTLQAGKMQSGATLSGTMQPESISDKISGDAATGMTALEKYAAEQEKKLKELLSAMAGVGEVEVMLTFVSSEERVVEKDAPTVRSNTVEKDSEGGTRTVTQFDLGDSTVYRSANGASEPYVVKVLNPRVEGVLVVAEGAGDGTVNLRITEIAQALFGVEAHRVKVMPMGTEATVPSALKSTH